MVNPKEFKIPSPEELREMRNALNLSGDEISYSTNIHKSVIYRWEKGERRPRADKLTELLNFYQEVWELQQ